jgi:hypothetical protein
MSMMKMEEMSANVSDVIPVMLLLPASHEGWSEHG